MTTRDRFERWIRTMPLCTKYNASLEKHKDGSYKDLRVRSAWTTWRNATEDEREACALICEESNQRTVAWKIRQQS